MPTRDDYRLPHSLRIAPYWNNFIYPKSGPIPGNLSGLAPSGNGGGLTAHLTNDFTNATATLAALALSLSVAPFQPLLFKLALKLGNSQAADGFQIDFAGGTVVAANFWALAQYFDTTGSVGSLTNASSTSLAGVLNKGLLSGTGTSFILLASGYIRSSSGGALTVRAACNTHSSGVLTISEGSYLWASP
jgi:hypothetical protein